MRYGFSILLFLVLATSLQAQPGPADQHARVDGLFADWDKPTSPGCALAIIRDGSIVYKRGYGMANLDHDIPITPSTVFHVASVSKQFTATAIVQVARQGKISLDDTVQMYVQELPEFSDPITIRHLVHHTSGLRDQWTLLGLAGWRYSLDLITDEDVLALMRRQKDVNFKPGAEYLYCNTGYTLMAQIVKRVSGMTFREFTSENIFLPLGMKDTHFRDDHAEIIKNQAYGYVPAEGGGFRLSVTNFDTVGATSLHTTVEDLARWDQNFYDGRVGGDALRDQLLQRGRLNDGQVLPYAFGLSRGHYRGLETIGHGGSDAGYRAHFVRFPGQRFAVACLCNVSRANPGNLAQKIADIYLADVLQPERPAGEGATVTLTEEELSPLTGIYWRRKDDATRRIVLEKGSLYLADPNRKVELKPLAADRFKVGNGTREMLFEASPKRLIEPAGSGRPVIFEAAVESAPTAEQLIEFTGFYTSEEIEAVYRVRIEEGKLVLGSLKTKPATLSPTIRDVFSGSSANLRFLRDSQGRVAGAILNRGRVRNFHFTKR